MSSVIHNNRKIITPKTFYDLPSNIDYLILIKEGAICVDLGATNRQYWGFPDLDGSDLEALKMMKDAIGEKVKGIITLILS